VPPTQGNSDPLRTVRTDHPTRGINCKQRGHRGKQGDKYPFGTARHHNAWHEEASCRPSSG